MMHFCIVLIVTWFNLRAGKALVIPLDSQVQLKIDGNNVELYKNEGNGSSWLQMVLVFARDSSNSQPKIIIDDKPCGKCPEVSTQAPIVCKEGFVLLESKKCYFFSTKLEKWHDALKTCQSLNTTLAYPLNAQENTVLVNYLKKNFEGSESWYLGGSDDVTEGQMIWAHSKSPIEYADWANGQPDDAGQTEDCVHIYKPFGWKWNDIPCHIPYNYVCQQM